MAKEIESDRRRVVILGGGFGGIYTALYLQSESLEERTPDVLLIDRHNYFLFSPLLHEVATGGVDIRNVAQAILPLSRDFGFRFLQADIAGIDVAKKQITTSGGVVDYDILVIALGSVANQFGVEGAADHALTLKTLPDAMRLRNRILGQFAAAAGVESAEEKRKKLTFVLVGGGPTGVELAAEAADYARRSLLRSYPSISSKDIRVVLVQSGEKVIPQEDPALSRAALQALEAHGCEVILSTKVVRVMPDRVELNNGMNLACETVVWTGGVKVNPLISPLPFEKDLSGRLLLDENLNVTGSGEVYALGDCALSGETKTGKSFPMLGQVAIRQGVRIAGNIINDLEGRPKEPFEYTYLGSLISLGTHRAIVNVLGMNVYGRLAWWLWRTFYLMRVIGFKNKVRILLDWSVDLLFDRDTVLLQ